ncbi:hypothetical protein NUSPORA_01350 [Nucleospora cyclopteri]
MLVIFNFSPLMDVSEIEEIIIMALHPHKSSDELKRDNRNIEKYNNHILFLLSSKDRNFYDLSHRKPSSRFIDKCLDKNFLRGLHEVKVIENQYNIFRNKITTNRDSIEFFSICEGSPSYAKYSAMLSKKDIESFVNIYCQLHGLSLEIDSDIIDFLYKNVPLLIQKQK